MPFWTHLTGTQMSLYRLSCQNSLSTSSRWKDVSAVNRIHERITVLCSIYGSLTCVASDRWMTSERQIWGNVEGRCRVVIEGDIPDICLEGLRERRQPVSGLKFEPGTCGIRSVNADCWPATYVVCDVISSDQVWDFWWDRRRWLWVVRSVRARICAQCASGCWNMPLPIWAERTRKCNSPKVISNIHICSPHVSKD